MIAIDTNILIYAHREDSPFHSAAYRRVAEISEGMARWAIPWPCIHEFLGTVTHPRIYAPPTPLAKAIEQVNVWRESPALALLTESAAHWPVLCQLLTEGRIAGPAVHDTRIAALCEQHGVHELWSADRDFGRFPKLKVVNPLVAD